MDFSDLFSNGKSDGPGPWRIEEAARLGSTVDQGGTDKRARRCLGGMRHMGARARQCSPAAVEEDEPDEAVPEGCSPEHERRQRGDATEVKNSSGLSSARGRRKVRGSSRERGKRSGEGRGCSSPFIGTDGALGRGGRGGNGRH
jgi:hypothetical protein